MNIALLVTFIQLCLVVHLDGEDVLHVLLQQLLPHLQLPSLAVRDLMQ